MAKQNELLRDHKGEDAELVQLGDAYIDIATRDLADLDEYGITAATVTALEDKRDAFSEFPQDTVYLNAQEVATAGKNTKRDTLETSLRGVYVRAVNTYGDKDPLLGSFGPQTFSRMGDEQVVRAGRLVHAAATEQQAALAAQGVDAAFLLALLGQIDALDEAIDNKNKAVRDRDNATRERILLANALYGDILKISRAGKDYYYSRNEAKYNDYVLDGSDGKQVRTGDLAPSTVVQITFEDIVAEDDLRLVCTGDQPIYYWWAATNAEPDANTSLITLQPEEAVQDTAANLGWTLLTPFLYVWSRLSISKYRAVRG